jgi:DNA-binding MarR family transcriptional regulator
MSQLKALFGLSYSGAVPVGQIGAMLGIHKPAASVLVDALVQLGLVIRIEDAADRRRTLVRLTPHAEELIARLQQGHREQFAYWLAQLETDDLVALERGLSALGRALKVEPDAPASAATDSGLVAVKGT